MPTDILIRSADTKLNRVTVNGSAYALTKDRRYTAPDEVIAALDSAGIPYSLWASSIVPIGQVRIPSTWRGPLKATVNGVTQLFQRGASFTPTAAMLAALASSGIPLEQGKTTRPASTPTTILKPTSTTGATANSAAVISYKAAPVAHPDGRTSFVAIKTLAADTFSGARWAAASIPAGLKLSDMKLVGLWVYWDAANGSVALRFTSDNFVSKTKTFSWAWSGQLHRGWNLITVNPAGTSTTNPGGTSWTVAGSYADSDTINGIEVQVNTNGAADTEIFLGDVFYMTSRPTRGAVCFGFDAFGESSIADTALPIFSKYGVKGYWAGDANLIENAGNAQTLAKRWYAAGHDVITQGYNHPDYTGASGSLAAHYRAAQALHRRLGFKRGLGLFSYPVSANDATTDAILAAEGVVMARSGWGWTIHPNEFNAGPKLIGHGAYNLGGKTLTQAKALVDQAAYYGVTFFPFCHGLTAGGTGTTPPGNTLLWYADDYDALMAYAVASDVDVDSPTQWLARRGINPSV